MRRFLLLWMGVFLAGTLFSGSVQAASRLQDPEKDRLVLVIDPGHGGENQGTIENGHEEKRMTMVTALAMYEELRQYEGVDVYLTHTEDVDMPLLERAEFAESVDADFLFSIHYNASANHELFGSEVWTSLCPPYNGYGYQFGYELLTDMKEKGLFVRGVKTRRGDDGEDYYGIIRRTVEREIPAVIIEHCHVDEERDAGFCDSDEKLQDFGRMDATAVAKYFGLKSSSLHVDYSGHQLAAADDFVKITSVDSTEPDVCIIDFLDADYEDYTLKFSVSAADYDSPLLYYSYSTDGGATFSPRETWPGADALTGSYTDTFTLEIPAEPGTAPCVILRAYNMYDLYTESNPYRSAQIFPSLQTEKPAEDPAAGAGETTGNVTEATIAEGSGGDAVPVAGNAAVALPPDKREEYISFSAFFKICIVVAGTMLTLVVVSQWIFYSRRRKRRRQRRKEAGASRNQQR